MPPSNFYGLPPSWNPGYEIPDYVMAEPPGRGAMVTDWLPRGTISALVPEFQAVRTLRPGGLGSLGDDTLGAQSWGGQIGLPDMIADYGRAAAQAVISSAKSVPAHQRPLVVRTIFQAVDPSLWHDVERLASENRRRGTSAPQALQHAMAQAMSAGFQRELVGIHERIRRGDPHPVKRRGQVALGVYEDAVPTATAYALEALGFSLSDLNPIKHIKNAGGAVVGAVKTAGGAIADAGRAVGRGVKRAAVAVGSAVKTGIKKLGSIACRVVNSAAGQTAVSASGTAGAAAAAGAQVANALCYRDEQGNLIPASPMPSSAGGGLPGWVKPAAIGGGILLGAVVLMKARR